MEKKHTFLVSRSVILLPKWLEDLGDVIIADDLEINNDLLKTTAAQYLITRSNIKINRDLLKGSKVKFYSTPTAGIDHLDIQFLRDSGIHFHNSAGCNSNSVAEYVIYSILFKYLNDLPSLKKKKIGVIGYGNIGKLLSNYLIRLGLEVYVCDPFKINEVQQESRISYSPLNFILDNCEIITNHVPLTIDSKYPTFRMIGKNLERSDQLELFIHTSRGKVVDELQLMKYAYLYKFDIAMDVWENEPKPDHYLVEQAIIATPHIAGHSYNGKILGSMQSYYELMKFLGEPISFVVPKVPLEKKIENMSFREIFERLDLFRKIKEDSDNFKKAAEFNNKSLSSSFKFQRQFYPIRYESIQ